MDSDGRGRRFSEGKEKSMSMSPTNRTAKDTLIMIKEFNVPIQFNCDNVSVYHAELMEYSFQQRKDGLDSSADQNGLTKRSPSPTSPPVKVAPRSITKVESRLLDLAKEKPSYRRRRDSSSDKETDRRKRKSKSPDERRKRSRTPPSRRSRSPRKSRSPRRRSRTPKRRNSSPDRNRSPVRRRSRSRSVTPPRRKRSRSPRKSRRSPSRTPPRRSRRSRSRSNERRRRSRSRSSDRRRRSRSRSRGKGRSRSRSRDRRSRRHSRSPSPMFTSKWGQRPTGICRAVLPANGDEKRTRQVTTEDVEKRLAQHMQTVQQKAAEDAKKINLPGYLNPAMVNVHQFKQVQDKRKLLWSKAKDKKDTASAQWSGAFDKDKDQSNDEKFRRLMGIGETAVEGGDSEKVQQSRKVLDDLEKEYEKSRAFQLSRGAGGLTGIGLGFGSAMQPQ